MGNIINRITSCWKSNDEQYASFINQDNLLLDNIQDRVNSYEDKILTLEKSLGTVSSGYNNLIVDLKKELVSLRHEHSELNNSHIHLNKEFRTMVILNKTQEEKLYQLENKLINMESESLFLEKSPEESNYLEMESQFETSHKNTII
jgi:metal-responsive CopG/Arc/MetJ family transcriptional regulator